MRAVTRISASVVLLGSAVLVAGGGPAAAKMLPFDRAVVTTQHPRAHQPVDVVVRFGNGFDIGDYAWENDEVSVLPASHTDSGGYPLDRNDRGIAIRLHHIAKGTYRGSFVVPTAGDYVIVDWSSVFEREDRAIG